MSQILDAVEETVAAEETPVRRTGVAEGSVDAGYGEFDYAPMPIVAPISAVLGVSSLIAFLGLFGIVLSVVAVSVALVACLKIWRSQGAYSGLKPALAGLSLSLFSAVGGSALMAYNYQHEVPEGFERVSFTRQISEIAFVEGDGAKVVHPDVHALVDRPIFIKGFMYPTGQTKGLTKFLLLKDSGQCCFGGQPALQDMVEVRMKDGTDVNYYSGRVSVAGTFKINPEYHGADPLEPLFLLECGFFSKAKTAF